MHFPSSFLRCNPLSPHYLPVPPPPSVLSPCHLLQHLPLCHLSTPPIPKSFIAPSPSPVQGDQMLDEVEVKAPVVVLLLLFPVLAADWQYHWYDSFSLNLVS
ncbi:hypothetical protein Cni_G16143 [Canna indica]|uniref:Uncharacterized protein n=1 Tax=Canna indica TaxID=4628 RepID=A0AAQ3KFS5_9LILI|nr:hypothetical protein Cni_G16143 [Canna indica]